MGARISVRLLVGAWLIGVAGGAWAQIAPPTASPYPPPATNDGVTLPSATALPYPAVAPAYPTVAPPPAYSRGLTTECAPTPAIVPLVAAPNPASSNFYARVDYFTWREGDSHFQLLAERGPLFTLGYQRRGESARFRAELFGGVVDYDGNAFTDEYMIPFASKTGYFGFRSEADFIRHLSCDPRTSFFVGLGTRLWDRGIQSGTAVDGTPVDGYHEVWWTVYPRLGVEFRQPLAGGGEWFASAGFGATLFTFENVHVFSATLYPKPGPIFQGELGWQGERVFVSLLFELMNWTASDMVGDQLVSQPESTMVTLGINAGLRF